MRTLPLFLALCFLGGCSDGTCIKEIPEFNQLAREQTGIRVFGVNYDGATGDELQQQVDRLGIEFPLLSLDPAAELGTERPVVLPTTLIIRPDGSLAATLVGPYRPEAAMAAIPFTNSTSPTTSMPGAASRR